MVDKLERHGIGARLGNRQPDETVEVVIHHFHLPEAQAVLVEFTGDAGVLDEMSEGADEELDEGEEADEPPAQAPGDPPFLPDAWREASQRVWGNQLNAQLGPPSEGALYDGNYVRISSSLADAERLEAAGIAVVVQVPSPEEGRNLALVHVPRVDLARAREILGIRL
ncbi:MAG: hypothetical protein ACRDGP_10185 [Actinomycetota bacterium]